jgi:hypothetical protein
MYFYCYVYVFLLLCMLCSVYSVFSVPIGTLRLPWLRFFRAFSSVVRQMPGYNSQRRDTVRTLPKLIVLFCVFFACKCVLYYCHWVATQLQLTNICIYIYLTFRTTENIFSCPGNGVMVPGLRARRLPVGMASKRAQTKRLNMQIKLWKHN